MFKTGMNAVSAQTIKRSAVKSRLVKLLGLLFAVTLSGNPVPPAHADIVNIAANSCGSAPDAGLVALDSIGEKLNPYATALALMTCSVPYSPLPATATAMGFYVDGDNRLGQTTTCTVLSADYTGQFGATASFTSSPLS